jgi:hypothetical protein
MQPGAGEQPASTEGVQGATIARSPSFNYIAILRRSWPSSRAMNDGGAV